jgi:hypothetical protein
MHNASSEHGDRLVPGKDPSCPQLLTNTVIQSELECRPADDANAQSAKVRIQEGSELIAFEEAARILGMKERKLRKIIQRSRERIDGKWTSGPTIRFFQCQPKAAIKFRRKWLEDFIQAYTHDPESASFLPTESPCRKKEQHRQTGFGPQSQSSEPTLGFDSSMYDL